MNENPLREEIEFFNESLPAWLSKFGGRFVVVKGRRLVAICDTEEEAVGQGAAQLGLTSFLVRRVSPDEEELIAPALSLGILSATIQRTSVSDSQEPKR